MTSSSSDAESETTEDILVESNFIGLFPDEQLSSNVCNLVASLLKSSSEIYRTRSFSMLSLVIEAATHDRHEKMCLILCNLLPCFLMCDQNMRSPQVSSPSKSMQVIRQLSLSWLRSVLKEHPSLSQAKHSETPPDSENVSLMESSSIYHPVLSLLQRLCVCFVDKADWRSATVDSIKQILLMLSANSLIFKDFVDFVNVLLNSGKANNRLFACEISVNCFVSEEVSHSSCDAMKVFACLEGRVYDVVASVRAHAIKGVGLALNSLSPESIDKKRILKILCFGLQDEKPTVRKVTLTNLFEFCMHLMTSEDILEISMFLKCISADESLMVRKASINTLSLLLSKFVDNSLVFELWAEGVLNLIVDPEQSVSEKALESVDKFIVQPLLLHASTRGLHKVAGKGEVYRLVDIICSKNETSELLQRAIKIVVKKQSSIGRKISSSLIDLLRANVRESSVYCWWVLVDSLTSIEIAHDPDLDKLAIEYIDYFFSEISAPSDQLLKIAKIALRILSAKKTVLTSAFLGSLLHVLRNFQVPSDLIFQTAKVLSVHQKLPWKKPLVSYLENEIISMARGEFKEEFTCNIELEVFRKLVTLSDIVLLSGDLLLSQESATIVGLQAIATDTVYKNSKHISLAPRIRSVAFSCLGKICLKNEVLAKKHISLFVAHLDYRRSNSLIRNSILLLMSDFAIHFTSVIDRYLLNLSACLRDPEEIIRRQTVMIFSSLIAEDFIKFRSQLIFRFLFVIADPIPDISMFAKSVFSRLILLKQPSLFKNIFADTICMLNGFNKHPLLHGSFGNADFCLIGEKARRRKIYDFMLSTLQGSEHKWEVTNQIAQVLLGGFLEDCNNQRLEIPSNESDSSAQVICDALDLLGCKELRLVRGAGSLPASANQNPTEFDGADAEEAATSAERTLLASVQKKNMTENIIPVLTQLKYLMEEKRSPLIRNVRETLLCLVKDYKDDLQNVLGNDQQLASEISFDLSSRRSRE